MTPGTSAGTGNPTVFRCSLCRRRRRPKSFRRLGYEVRLTGRTRPYKAKGSARRGTDTAREYVCLDCGHVGWSNHADLTLDRHRR